MKKAIKKLKKKSGQAIVEMALMLPLLLSILCGVLDFGWIFVNQYKVEYASYNGARYASILVAQSDDHTSAKDAIEARVRNNLPDPDLGDITVSINAGRKEVTIEISYPVKTLTFVAELLNPSGYYTASASNTVVY